MTPVPAPAKAKKVSVPVPPELQAAFRSAPGAKAAFDGMPPSHRRAHVEFITEAKKPETRERRAVQTVRRLEQGGKGRKG